MNIHTINPLPHNIFRHVKIEIIGKLQIKCGLNIIIPLCQRRKKMGKRRIRWLPKFSTVPMFLKALFHRTINPLPDDKILDWSKLKQFADDNFEFDINSRKFSQPVENTVDKGEIAHYEQFLLFLQCFQKACFPRASKGFIMWE